MFLYMSDLATYKATFKTANNGKDPEQIEKIFVENLQTVKDDSKNISSIVNQHIDKLMESFNPASSKSTWATNSASSIPSSSTVNNTKVKGNYYSAGRDITINETAERDIKKQKTNHKDKEEVEEVDFKQKWVDFLADAEQNKNFHHYSLEKNGVSKDHVSSVI